MLGPALYKALPECRLQRGLEHDPVQCPGVACGCRRALWGFALRRALLHKALPG